YRGARHSPVGDGRRGRHLRREQPADGGSARLRAEAASHRASTVTVCPSTTVKVNGRWAPAGPVKGSDVPGATSAPEVTGAMRWTCPSVRQGDIRYRTPEASTSCPGIGDETRTSTRPPGVSASVAFCEGTSTGMLRPA